MYSNDICTKHFLKRIDERKINATGIKYALEYGSQCRGQTPSRSRHTITPKMIHRLFFKNNLSREDMIALTIIESRGGLTVVRDKKGILITSYHKCDEKKEKCKPKKNLSVAGNHSILGCITELATTQPIKVNLSRSEAKQACKWYCSKEVN